jgi:hypothetical protein
MVKYINVAVEDAEYMKMIELKGRLSWRNVIRNGLQMANIESKDNSSIIESQIESPTHE